MEVKIIINEAGTGRQAHDHRGRRGNHSPARRGPAQRPDSRGRVIGKLIELPDGRVKVIGRRGPDGSRRGPDGSRRAQCHHEGSGRGWAYRDEQQHSLAGREARRARRRLIREIAHALEAADLNKA
ncbi:MAG: hypothetical protein KIS95_13435 [Anaerolineae bacterium]|uniref:hypothetical protein n=1 Tax=Promineifilum sp. TaxID=2664178 RepID=UPI001D6A213A|nr:hypothetical protein [Anaerolineales bacterium]MCO5179324.1 hypothetical protein [Promineifilum sp.]MCW5848232.1 hypothetical protein [Anaerolineae bacterium]